MNIQINQKMKNLLVAAVAVFTILMISFASASDACVGDADGNNVVNPAERGFIHANMGCVVADGNPECARADLDGNGVVTPADLGVISANMGNTCEVLVTEENDDGTLNTQDVEPERSSGGGGGSSANTYDYRYSGRSGAPVRIDAYVAFDEPLSAKWYVETFPRLKETFIDGGHVKINFRHYPLSDNQNMIDGAIAAECAAEQKKFLQYADALFQAKYVEASVPVNLNKEVFRSYAKSKELNMNRFEHCLKNSKTRKEVEREAFKASLSGATGHPVFFIDGKLYTGPNTYSSFAKALIATGKLRGFENMEFVDLNLAQPVIQEDTEEPQDFEEEVVELEEKVEEQESIFRKILSFFGRFF